MTDDTEVLSTGSELSKYMTEEGFTDFETYEQCNKSKTDPNGHHQYAKTRSSLFNNNLGLDCKIVESIFNSSHDQIKFMNLLDSKLLLPEDFQLIEFLITRTTASNFQTKYLWFYSGGLIASVVSLLLCLHKQFSCHLPAALTTGFSFFCLRHCYAYFQTIFENKSFSSDIGSLQNLCLNVHKVLRLLKETEILSTGQVTTHNVGAALYIPIKNLKELESYPTWKTLPHLRKCLANSLLDMLDLLKSTCNEVRKVVPNWLHIEDYTFFSETVQSGNNLLSNGSYISLKDLQLLSDSYLILQSELLRWVGFCLCPGIWNMPSISHSDYKYNRIKILKLFHSCNSKLSKISFKLKMHHDIQKIFLEGEEFISEKLPSNDTTEINNIQLELHNLFLLILSMLSHLKSLEEQLENNSKNDVNSDMSILRESLNQQLKNVRHELTSAVNMFDTVCSNSFPNKRLSPSQLEKSEKEHFDNSILKSQSYPTEEDAKKSDCHINSCDEVFLAITDLTPNEQENNTVNWDISSEPQIPKNLLSELSTTLKPIKENFKEREKLALERAGLVDINNESNSENELTDKKQSSAKSSPEIKKRSKPKSKRIYRKSFCNTTDKDSNCDNSLHPNEDSDNNPTQVLRFSPNLSESTGKEVTSLPVLNEKSIANLIAMKSQSWGLAEEEYYSDD